MTSPYKRQDRFFKRAKQDRFAARSIYKLEEIDRRHQLFQKGMVIVDLGCAPGSWIQYLANVVGPKGSIVGYDLAPVEIAAGPQVKTFEVDVFALEADRIRLDAGGSPVDALVSDMAPKLTGIRDADQARSIGLAEKALALAEALVRPGGSFVAKVFQGRDIDAFTQNARRLFAEVKILKPEATREGSREAFVVAKSRRSG